MTDFWTTTTVPAAAAGAILITGAALLALIAWWSRTRSPALNDRSALELVKARHIVLGALVLVACAALIALEARRVLLDHEDKALTRLQAVAKYQAAQLANWLEERRTDADFVRTSPYIANLFAQWTSAREEPVRQSLIDRLRKISPSAVYSNLVLFADDGSVLWSREDDAIVVHASLRDALESSRRNAKVLLVGPYLDDKGRLWLDVVAPIPREHLPESRAAMVFRIDPTRTIHPMLADWPSDSASGETVLVEYRQDRVVYLNAPRHGDRGSLRLERPIDDKRLLAVQVRDASYRKGSRLQGVDYRGVPVLGAGDTVRGTAWNLVAKVDVQEARAGALAHVWLLVGGGMLAVLGTAGALVLWRQHQEHLFDQRLHADQAQKLRALQLFEAISDSSTDAIFAKDLEGRYLFCNAEIRRLTGRSADQILGRHDTEIFPRDAAAMMMANDRRTLAENRPISVEETLSTPDGNIVFLAVKGPLRNADGSAVGTYGIARNITSARNAEIALKDRERKLSAIVDNSPSALSMKDREGRYVIANPNVERLLGRKMNEILGKTDLELHPAATAALLRAHDEQVLRTGQPQRVEENFQTSAGPRTYASYMFPVSDETGAPGYVCRISLDITSQLQSTSELRKIAADLSSTLQAIPDLLFELDEHGRYLSVRTTQADRLAMPVNRLIGRTVFDVLPAAQAETIMAAIGIATQTGADYGKVIELSLPDGTRHFELSVAAKDAVQGEPRSFIVLSRDITTRQAIEDSLRRRTDELARRNEELERFNRLTVGRELDMIELKKEVNELLVRQALPARYAIPRLDDHPDTVGAA